MSRSPAQRLEVFQSLWAMEARSPSHFERPPEEHFARIATAGFAGICLDPAVEEIDACLRLRPLFRQYGLKCLINAFPRTVADLEPLLALGQELESPFVSIVGGLYPLSVDGAVPIVRRWLDDSRRANMPILFETHRDSITNDMFFTLQLLDAVPEMRLCADLSHYVVGRELRLPVSPHFQALFRRLIERSDSFQGRIASREQIQVPLDFPQHAQWVGVFREWWEQGIADWRRRAASDATLIFLCELGPAPYAITDAHGVELSDRWSEALQIRRWIETIWTAQPR